ncbi:hypothetical protein CERSUDRAFT_126322 [Gelatoporia subvermispora B]|uniref:Uncharacterized protein n=1 Tax=Ceriporiopsis subvermispora (strain B) TaxID=914234 RepID=M2Q8H8_CERS8|nr:hypothetical protein CERSUDRAFT_126322 [Gelatoporia subvermispora B]
MRSLDNLNHQSNYTSPQDMTASASNYMEVDAHLSQLFSSLQLDGKRRATSESAERVESPPPLANDDLAMSDSDSEGSIYQSSPSSSHIKNISVQPCGCALLQYLQDQVLDTAPSHTPAPTDGYLEAIFVHREALCALPQAHRACAHACGALAEEMSRRADVEAAWRESVMEAEVYWQEAAKVAEAGWREAANAFMHEAQVVEGMCGGW